MIECDWTYAPTDIYLPFPFPFVYFLFCLGTSQHVQLATEAAYIKSLRQTATDCDRQTDCKANQAIGCKLQAKRIKRQAPCESAESAGGAPAAYASYAANM